jgi:uncharacterized membrane protein
MNRFLLITISSVRIAALVVLVMLATVAYAQITTFDPPNSTSTLPQAINRSGQITGYYSDTRGAHGFLREPNGTIVRFDVPPAGIALTSTQAQSINALGQITGNYFDPALDLDAHPFLRQPDGEFTWGGPSGARSQLAAAPFQGGGMVANDINRKGQITGVRGNAGVYSSYLRQRDGTIIDFDATTSLGSTQAQAINLRGQITGYYRLLFNDYHGFLRKLNGTIITFDPPNSTNTFPQAINLRGQITGYYGDATGVAHGFLRQPNGTIITFDPAGSIGTQATALNVEGQVTGYYVTADGIYHGFLRRRNGNIETFDIPGTGNGGTFPRDINDLGQIVGYYQDSNFTLHGFVRSRRNLHGEDR